MVFVKTITPQALSIRLGIVKSYKREAIAYEADGRPFEGWLVVPDHCRPQAPGILVFHEFMGLGDYLDRHLQHLADLGYVAMAADMYGRGIRPEDEKTALGYSRPLRNDRKHMRRLAAAALSCLRDLPFVDSQTIAAIGYSFGGCVALELARSGADLKAAVSIYGYLDAPQPAVPNSIKARLLIFHGMHDPVVPQRELSHSAGMKAACADSGWWFTPMPDTGSVTGRWTAVSIPGIATADGTIRTSGRR